MVIGAFFPQIILNKRLHVGLLDCPLNTGPISLLHIKHYLFYYILCNIIERYSLMLRFLEDQKMSSQWRWKYSRWQHLHIKHSHIIGHLLLETQKENIIEQERHLVAKAQLLTMCTFEKEPSSGLTGDINPTWFC